MGIILPINDKCRIECDATQWFVMRARGENWEAATFWQQLDQAIKDCVYLGLATPAEVAILAPTVSYIDSMLARLPADAVARHKAFIDIGGSWYMESTKGRHSTRLHWVIRNKASSNKSKEGEIDGTYRSFGYALRRHALARMRRSDDINALSTIVDELLTALTRTEYVYQGR